MMKVPRGQTNNILSIGMRHFGLLKVDNIIPLWRVVFV